MDYGIESPVNARGQMTLQNPREDENWNTPLLHSLSSSSPRSCDRESSFLPLKYCWRRSASSAAFPTCETFRRFGSGPTTPLPLRSAPGIGQVSWRSRLYQQGGRCTFEALIAVFEGRGLRWKRVWAISLTEHWLLSVLKLQVPSWPCDERKGFPKLNCLKIEVEKRRLFGSVSHWEVLKGNALKVEEIGEFLNCLLRPQYVVCKTELTLRFCKLSHIRCHPIDLGPEAWFDTRDTGLCSRYERLTPSQSFTPLPPVTLHRMGPKTWFNARDSVIFLFP